MDAQAHLISLGWAGPGHALDSRPQYKQKGHRGLAYNPALDPLKVGNTGNGLVKPLTISKRKDRFGIGKKSHEPASGTEWWLKGFETALGNIGKSESERSGTNTPVMGSGAKHVGLYGFFVKGQVMEGTMSQVLAQQARGKKRKSDALDATDDADLFHNGTKGNKARTTGLEVSPVRRKAETATDFAIVGAFMEERDKQDGRRRRAKDEAGSVVQQFAEVGNFLEAAKEAEGTKSKKNKKKRKSEALFQDVEVDQTPSTTTEDHTRLETKEERRERRRKRREKREREKASREGVDLDAGRDKGKTADTTDEEVQTAEITAAQKEKKKTRVPKTS